MLKTPQTYVRREAFVTGLQQMSLAFSAGSDEEPFLTSQGTAMTVISDADTIRCRVVLRNPFTVVGLPLLSRVHKAAFRERRRVSKRFVGKPAKQLFRLLLAAGIEGTGQVRLETRDGARTIGFNARNTQFGALYLPQEQPVYEAETSALLDRLVGHADIFYDVGANWGWYSVLIATRPSFSGSVHAFEPFPSTFVDLTSVVRQAGLEAQVQCHDIALADTEGSARMAYSDGVQSGLARLGAGDGVAVRMAKLDALSLPTPTVIKVDAEDHELNVLIGASGVIESARPFIVFENWLHPERPDLTLAPTAFLAGKGYQFYFPGWVSGAPDCIRAERGASVELALVPFLPVQRFQLPQQINIVAVPEERLADFQARFR